VKRIDGMTVFQTTEIQSAIDKTLHMYEWMYSDLRGGKKSFIKFDYVDESERYRIYSYCYLCDYSKRNSGPDCISLCKICPCVVVLGDQCFHLNRFIAGAAIDSNTVKWSLRKLYRIAERYSVPTNFTYWDEVKYSRVK